MKQRGFSIVELMVSITIGFIILAGLTTLFANSSYSRTEMNKAGQKIENGRYAASLIADELALAGYWGDFIFDESAVSFTNRPICELANLGIAEGPPVQIPVGVFSLVGWPSGGCRPPDYKSGTQALLIRRLSTEILAVESKDLYFQSSNCSKDPKPVIVAIAPDVNPSSPFILKTKECDPALPVAPPRRVISRIFYIASCNICSGTHADTVPTLKMLEVVKGAFTTSVSMVEGIDDIQIDFALDRLDDDGNDVNAGAAYKGPNGVADSTGIPPGNIADDCSINGRCWANVVGASVNVLARNSEPSAGHDDTAKTYQLGSRSVTIASGAGAAYKRHVFSTAARMANVAGRREK